MHPYLSHVLETRACLHVCVSMRSICVGQCSLSVGECLPEHICVHARLHVNPCHESLKSLHIFVFMDVCVSE